MSDIECLVLGFILGYGGTWGLLIAYRLYQRARGCE
jgi:hypothetical protein